jgi:DNA-directed RNA polymerase specialized sigma54-like protein
MQNKELKPDAATDKPKLAAIPAEYQPRFESDKELKAFIDQKELLRRLPVARRTITNWRRAGKIPSIVIGRRVLFCWENVSAALRRLERGAQ